MSLPDLALKMGWNTLGDRPPMNYIVAYRGALLQAAIMQSILPSCPEQGSPENQPLKGGVALKVACMKDCVRGRVKRSDIWTRVSRQVGTT